MKSIEVLVSTMNNDYSLIQNLNLECDSVIINQCGYDSIVNFSANGAKVKWINSSQRGLSRSRNLALLNSEADLCLIADDDLSYIENYSSYIIDNFEREIGFSILVFIVEGKNKKFKNYLNYAKKLNFFTAMKVSSVQIAFKRSDILDNNILFKEEFGSGSLYPMGEENIWLSQCLKKGLKIKYIPLKIAEVFIGESSWFRGFNEQYLLSQGAVYAEMSHRLYWLLIVVFAVRKKNLFDKNISFIKAIFYMFKGARRYIKDRLRNQQ
jgi:hypothetical protein